MAAAWKQRPWRHKSPAWWAQRVTWYPDGCFGPYRSAQEGYSRRELAADAAVHLTGVSMGCVGALLMLERVADPACPAAVRLGLGVYACSVRHHRARTPDEQTGSQAGLVLLLTRLRLALGSCW